MIPLLTADEMRALEADAIQTWGIPSLVLQEHAARGALDLIPPGEPIHVLAGPGNNGGDALALARLARLRGESVTVWTLGTAPTWSGDAALQAALWAGLGGVCHPAEHLRDTIAAFRGWVVDGLLGLGTRLPLRPPLEAWALELMQVCRKPPAHRGFRVLALDLPTGLDPSGPDAPGPVIPADVTACFGHLKVCHGLRPARGFCGEITVVPLPLRQTPEARIAMITPPRRPKQGRWDAHKRDFGHLAIRAGTPGMGGAAVLAALGALRMGAGLVTVLTDPEVRAEVASQVPEAMVRVWQGRVPEGVDVLLAGPGGVSEIPEWAGPLVLDASALGPKEGPRWMARPETVITPHPGEFVRLFRWPQPLSCHTSERLRAVREVATGPGILALKGAQSVVAGGPDDRVLVNTTGHRGLATGGTGDFLAGMVAGAMAACVRDRGAADRERLREAVAEAVWLHGAAADRLGPGPLLVRDLGDSLAAILRDLGCDPECPRM